MIAASEGHLDAFHALVQRGAAIDDADEDGKTILHLAAQKNHCEVLRVCIIITAYACIQILRVISFS